MLGLRIAATGALSLLALAFIDKAFGNNSDPDMSAFDWLLFTLGLIAIAAIFFGLFMFIWS